MDRVIELVPKRPPLHDVPYEGGNIDFGEIDCFLKQGWCGCLEQSLDLHMDVEDRHRNHGSSVCQTGFALVKDYNVVQDIC